MQAFFAVIGGAFVLGVFFTVGMMATCMAFGWTPCTTTVHVHAPEGGIVDVVKKGD